MKCKFGCSEYGRGGACPPATPSVAACKDFFNEYSFKRAFQPLRTPAVFARIAAATACYELIEAALTEIQMDETEPDAGRSAGNHNWGIEIK